MKEITRAFAGDFKNWLKQSKTYYGIVLTPTSSFFVNE